MGAKIAWRSEDPNVGSGEQEIDDGQARVTVFLAPTSKRSREAALALVDDAELPGTVACAAPASWRVPELGFAGTGQAHGHAGMAELLHPTTHGNPLAADGDRFTVLLASASTASADVQGIVRFSQALRIRPLEFIEFDVSIGAVTDRRVADEGQWAGIPVPTF